MLSQPEYWTVNVGGCFRLKACEAEKDGGSQQDNVKGILKNLFFVANIIHMLNRRRKRGLKVFRLDDFGKSTVAAEHGTTMRVYCHPSC